MSAIRQPCLITPGRIILHSPQVTTRIILSFLLHKGLLLVGRIHVWQQGQEWLWWVLLSNHYSAYFPKQRHTALAPACPVPVNSWDQLKYVLTTRPRLIIAPVINVELLAYLFRTWCGGAQPQQPYCKHRNRAQHMKIVLLVLETGTAMNEQSSSWGFQGVAKLVNWPLFLCHND